MIYIQLKKFTYTQTNLIFRNIFIIEKHIIIIAINIKL